MCIIVTFASSITIYAINISDIEEQVEQKTYELKEIDSNDLEIYKQTNDCKIENIVENKKELKVDMETFLNNININDIQLNTDLTSSKPLISIRNIIFKLENSQEDTIKEQIQLYNNSIEVQKQHEKLLDTLEGHITTLEILIEESIPTFEGVQLQYSAKYNVCDYPMTATKGVVYFNGHRETYYSQRVLPGGGLKIPGRHVADDGTIRDEDGYIVVAADLSYLPRYSTVMTSLGPAKVYDTGCAYGTIDIYVDW